MFSTPRSAPSTSPPASWSSSISTSTSQPGQSRKPSLKTGDYECYVVLNIIQKKKQQKKQERKPILLVTEPMCVEL